MRFSELLDVYIGLSRLEEIVAECEARGVKVDPSYLSRLRAGTRPAPDDGARVRVLAEACHADPEPLILLAEIERSPQKFIERTLNTLLQLAELHSAVHQRSRKFFSEARMALDNGLPLETLREMLANAELSALGGVDEQLQLRDLYEEIQKATMWTLGDTRAADLRFPEWAAREADTTWHKAIQTKLVNDLAEVTEVDPAALWVAIMTARATQLQSKRELRKIADLLGMPVAMGARQADDVQQ